MINRNTFSKLSIVAAVAAAVASPVLAQAGTCAGPKVAWTSKSNAASLQCGQLSSRGESKGSGSGFGPYALSARLISGIHASGIAYNQAGVMSNCAPFDASTADGAKSVSGLPCLGATHHQVVVAF